MVESACSAGDPGSIHGSGRSPGEGNANILAWKNPIDGGAWQAIPHGVTLTAKHLRHSDLIFITYKLILLLFLVSRLGSPRVRYFLESDYEGLNTDFTHFSCGTLGKITQCVCVLSRV